MHVAELRSRPHHVSRETAAGPAGARPWTAKPMPWAIPSHEYMSAKPLVLGSAIGVCLWAVLLSPFFLF